jgi:uncharacterized protein YegP (UPF0339 family)
MLGFELYQDKGGEFRWRLRAKNNEVVAQSSEGYSDKRSAQRSIEILREGEKSANPEIYEADGQYRFRVTAKNGNVIAVGQAYKNEADCAKTVTLLNEIAPTAPVADDTVKQA